MLFWDTVYLKHIFIAADCNNGQSHMAAVSAAANGLSIRLQLAKQILTKISTP